MHCLHHGMDDVVVQLVFASPVEIVSCVAGMHMHMHAVRNLILDEVKAALHAAKSAAICFFKRGLV
jgi:hypothetical protein